MWQFFKKKHNDLFLAVNLFSEKIWTFGYLSKTNFNIEEKLVLSTLFLFNLYNNKKFFFLNFLFFKTVIFGYFWFVDNKHPKTTKDVRKTAKIINLPYYLSHFIKKNSLFDVDLFSRTFDMESPKWHII